MLPYEKSLHGILRDADTFVNGIESVGPTYQIGVCIKSKYTTNISPNEIKKLCQLDTGKISGSFLDKLFFMAAVLNRLEDRDPIIISTEYPNDKSFVNYDTVLCSLALLQGFSVAILDSNEHVSHQSPRQMRKILDLEEDDAAVMNALTSTKPLTIGCLMNILVELHDQMAKIFAEYADNGPFLEYDLYDEDDLTKHGHRLFANVRADIVDLVTERMAAQGATTALVDWLFGYMLEEHDIEAIVPNWETINIDCTLVPKENA